MVHNVVEIHDCDECRGRVGCRNLLRGNTVLVSMG